ncbi:Replication factor-A C terminal domain-containing protein [Forsythia ovata]|uniref:Replication factor-A C terminal domain-containing protein n=1 Tax=Forsythia ovata TaxID=205694 RepID=A0ABD1WA55_9LAMI
MITQHKLISEISPGQYNWTAKVIVAEKSSPKIAHSSPTKYLHLWLIDPSMDANSDMLNSIVMKKSYMLPTSAIISCPPGDKFTKIKEMQELLLMQKSFWIKATLSLKWTKQPVWYMACSNCNKISAAQYNEVYLCVFCKYPHSRAIPRGRATVELRDNTGSITATVIGEAAEKFFDCCAEELMHQDTMEDRPNNIPVFRTHIEDEHVVYVKSANRATIPNQTLFDVIFILDPDTVIKETEALEFLSTNKQSSSLSISTIPREQEGNNSSVRRVLFGASSEPQEKKKQKQEESMHPDNDVTTFNSDDVDKNNYSFSDGTSSASK